MLTLPTIPEETLNYGFVLPPVGAHTSKTMMLTELSHLIEGSSQNAEYEDLRRLIVEDNVTLKDSLAARKDTFNRLAQLYALRRERPVYRALRELWPTSVEEQPVMAILCALSRDPLLRSTAPIVLNAEPDTPLTPQILEEGMDDGL